MRHRLPFVLSTSLTALALVAQQPPDGERPRRPRREPVAVELKNFTFQEQRFASEAVGKEMPYGVYLPKGYEDAEHQALAVVVEDRSAGYLRRHRLDLDFVTTGEFRTLAHELTERSPIRTGHGGRARGKRRAREVADNRHESVIG